MFFFLLSFFYKVNYLPTKGAFTQNDKGHESIRNFFFFFAFTGNRTRDFRQHPTVYNVTSDSYQFIIYYGISPDTGSHAEGKVLKSPTFLLRYCKFLIYILDVDARLIRWATAASCANWYMIYVNPKIKVLRMLQMRDTQKFSNGSSRSRKILPIIKRNIKSFILF